jgi:hypothetical protein
MSDSSEMVVCPDCGAGRGRPHFMRCEITVPAYDRPVGIRQVRGLTAYAIWVFPLNMVRRPVIRAMLPRGQRILRGNPELRHGKKSKTRNPVSNVFGLSLEGFEAAGWIWKTPERIHVLRREQLYGYARKCLPTGWDWTVGVHQAIADLVDHFPGAAPAEQDERDRELAALRRLMETTPATGPHSGRGWARITPRPGRPE